MNAGWWFDDEPEPDEDAYWLLTDKDAEVTLGIKASTIRCWKRRKKLYRDGIDSLGRDVFYKHKLLALAQSRKRKA